MARLAGNKPGAQALPESRPTARCDGDRYPGSNSAGRSGGEASSNALTAIGEADARPSRYNDKARRGNALALPGLRRQLSPYNTPWIGPDL